MFFPRSVCDHHPSNLSLSQNSFPTHLCNRSPGVSKSSSHRASSIVSEPKRNSMSSQNHEPITLTILPPELLLTIADHLSLAGRGCLALRNHGLLEILFNIQDQLKECFRVIAPDNPLVLDMNDTRISFLTQLSKDLPQYYPCLSQDCLKLTPGDTSRDLAMTSTSTAQMLISAPRSSPIHADHCFSGTSDRRRTISMLPISNSS